MAASTRSPRFAVLPGPCQHPVSGLTDRSTVTVRCANGHHRRSDIAKFGHRDTEGVVTEICAVPRSECHIGFSGHTHRRVWAIIGPWSQPRGARASRSQSISTGPSALMMTFAG